MNHKIFLWALMVVTAAALGCAKSKKADEKVSAKPPVEEAAKPPVEKAEPAPASPICIEAEHFKANVKQGGISWLLVTQPKDFSGKGAMQAMPNEDVLNEEDLCAKESPRLDYDVNFPEAGTYYVWVRGCGETEEDNSCHVGLDGKVLESSDKIAEFETEWTWTSDSKDFERPIIKVATAGKHVLNVWMREDGFVFDRIVLTLDSEYKPTGKGP